MSVASLIIQLIAGAIGGNVAGCAIRGWSLGMWGNTLAGVAGGGIVGQCLLALLRARGIADPSAILANVAGGGVGGVMLMLLAGAILAHRGKSRR
ncbi:hypothetical protein [Dyella acidiphila]|uniref:GlsB/YeaQ/YmgE family stress response membrane protein n=1 Tax=Dyella acidiphila TaxID=2775866 RepID=A0ABR9GG09_9GAMM|nr:hypothetical protein [Dyella acidiphila]MBE1162967.1 hypothetical protein [Dyella acidiphila]